MTLNTDGDALGAVPTYEYSDEHDGSDGEDVSTQATNTGNLTEPAYGTLIEAEVYTTATGNLDSTAVTDSLRVNRGPNATGRTVTLQQGQNPSTVEVQLSVSDPDSNEPGYAAGLWSLPGVPNSEATIDQNDGAVTILRPAGGWPTSINAEVEVEARYTDEWGAIDVADAVVRIVTVPNAPPEANNNQSFTVQEGQSNTVNLNGLFSDPDGDALTYVFGDGNTIFAIPGGPTLRIIGSILTFDAGTGATGTYDFDVEATDPDGASDTSSGWTIEVTAAPTRAAPPSGFGLTLS